MATGGPGGPDIERAALIIVDMQNDFVHPDGAFAHRAKENPEAEIDMEFLGSTVAPIKRLAAAFREAGRPVVYIAHVVKPDYSDAAFPYWRRPQPKGNRTFIAEGTWGAEIIDELAREEGEHPAIKKASVGSAKPGWTPSFAIRTSTPAWLPASPPAFACRPPSAAGLSTTTA
jgi:nicotinamidase-related amidase